MSQPTPGAEEAGVGPSLGRRATRGAGVSIAAQAIRFVIQIASLTVLARLLTPQQFGVVAMVTAVVNVAEIVRDFGLSSAAIQAKHLDDDERTNLFWANVGIGTTCSLVAVACTPLAEKLYGTSAVGPIMLSLSWLFIVSGANTQFRAELSRGLKFKALAVTDVLAQLSASTVAVTAAVLGAGYWAIVLQQITVTLVTCASNVTISRWRPGWPRRDVSITRFFRFGGHVLGTQLLGYSTNNIDNVALGAYAGAGPLGLYSRAYQLLLIPISQINASLTRVVLPVLSRVQDEDVRYERFVLRSQLAGCYVLGVLMAVAAGASVPIVAILFGPHWSGVAPIFSVLAVGGVFRGIGSVSYWIFLSRGHSGAQLKMYLYTRPPMILIILAGLPWGPVGVATGHSVAFFLFWIVSLRQSCRAVGISSRPLFAQATRALLFACVPTGLAAYAGTLLVSNPFLQLAVAGVLSSVVLGLALLAMPRERREVVVIFDAMFGIYRSRITPGRASV